MVKPVSSKNNSRKQQQQKGHQSNGSSADPLSRSIGEATALCERLRFVLETDETGMKPALLSHVVENLNPIIHECCNKALKNPDALSEEERDIIEEAASYMQMLNYAGYQYTIIESLAGFGVRKVFFA